MIFIYEPGTWLGEGTIAFTVSSEKIRFFTRWVPMPAQEENQFQWTQTVEMASQGEHIQNFFTFTPLKEGLFSVKLENDMIGKATGKGVFDAKKVAWEVTSPESFQGFEVYEMHGDELHFHAEYVAPDNFRTRIEGILRKKVT